MGVLYLSCIVSCLIFFIGLCKNGECANTIGSFTCLCPEGTLANDFHECVDEDECLLNKQEGNNICPNGKCINRDPGYYCECDSGFIPTQVMFNIFYFNTLMYT